MTLANKLLKAKLNELKTQSGSILEDLLASTYKEQREFILDPSPFRAALTPRRAGKTYAVSYSLLYKCFQYPGCITAYLNRSEIAALKTLNPALKKLKLKHNIDMTWNKGDRTWYFDNGSEIFITGADADQRQQDKFRGQSYKHISLDEASFFKTNLNEFFDDVLLHLIAGEEGGQMDFISSPGYLTADLFYEITALHSHPEWSTHTWDWTANLALKDLLQKMLDKKLIAHPDFINTPAYKREWLGQWFIDDGALIFHFDNRPNSINRISVLKEANYTYFLSIDLGYEDSTAFVIVAFSPHDSNLYVVHTEKTQHLTASDVVERVGQLFKSFPISFTIGDTGGGGSKQIVKDIERRYQIQISAPDKTSRGGRQGQCYLLDSDLRMGKIKLLPKCEPLIEEWNKLILDQDKKAKNIWEPHPSCENHLADAFRYAWSAAYNYTAKPAPNKTPPIHSKEYIDYWMEKEAEKIVKAKQPKSLFDELEDTDNILLNPTEL